MMNICDPQDILIYKRSRAKIKKILNNGQSTRRKNYSSSISSNTKLNQLWSIVKRFNKQPNSNHVTALKLNGISSISDTDKTNMLACHFQSTNSNKNYLRFFLNSFPSIPYTLQHKLHYQSYKKMDFSDSFSIKELRTAPDDSNESVVGADNLNCEMLKHMTKHCLNIILL